MCHQQLNAPRRIWYLNSNLKLLARKWRSLLLNKVKSSKKYHLSSVTTKWRGRHSFNAWKKDNTRPGKILIIWGIFLIVTCYRNSYSYWVCNQNICLICDIKENHILNWRFIWLLHVHAKPFKMIRFVGLIEIINKYLETMTPDMHCSHPILNHSDYFLRDEAFAFSIF